MIYINKYIDNYDHKLKYMNILQKLTIQLINQPSINLKNNDCHSIIINFLKKLHFIIELMNFQDTINIWAYRGEKKYKTLLFLGHTDVVTPGNLNHWKYPPFAGLIHDHILYGRGASDMKGALAAMLIAIKNFVEKFPHYPGRIACIITSDEEGTGTNGTVKVINTLIQRHENIDYCIVGEPSSTLKIGDVIKNGRRGSLTVKLKIHGIQGHVAYPQFLKNPIHTTLPALLTLLTNTSWEKKSSNYFPTTTMQITDINTNNNNNNITPNHILLNFNFRFNDQTPIHHIKNKIHEILTYYKLTYHINYKLFAEPYLSTPGQLTKTVMQVIKNYQKITPLIETTGGTSDGRFVAKMGTEIIELGALHHTIHKVNECIHLTDLKQLNIIYQKIIENLFLPTHHSN